MVRDVLKSATHQKTICRNTHRDNSFSDTQMELASSPVIPYRLAPLAWSLSSSFKMAAEELTEEEATLERERFRSRPVSK